MASFSRSNARQRPFRRAPGTVRVRSTSASAVQLSLADEAVVEALGEPTEPMPVGDTPPTASAQEVPAPVSSLLPSTMAPWEVELADTDAIPMEGHLPTEHDVAHTIQSAQILEMFVDPTSSVEQASRSSTRAKRARRSRRGAPIDPVVFEVTDRARAALGVINAEEEDVWA